MTSDLQVAMAAVRLRQLVLLLTAAAVVAQRPPQGQQQQLWQRPRQGGAPAVLLRRSSAVGTDEWHPLGPVGPVPHGPTLQYAPPVMDGGPLRPPIHRRVDGPLPQAQPGPVRRRRPRPPQNQQNRPLPPRRRPTGQQQWSGQRPQQKRRPQRPQSQQEQPQRRPQRPPPQQNPVPQQPQRRVQRPIPQQNVSPLLPPQRFPQQNVAPQLSQPPQRRPQRPEVGEFRPPQLPPTEDRFSFSEDDSDGWTPAGLGGLQSVPAPVNLNRPAAEGAVPRPEPATDSQSAQSTPLAVVQRVPVVNAPPPPTQTGAPAFQPPVDRLPADAFTPIRDSNRERDPEVRPGPVERIPEVQEVRLVRPALPERLPVRPPRPQAPVRNERPPFAESTVGQPTVPEVPAVEPVTQRTAATTEKAEAVVEREEIKRVVPERRVPRPTRRPVQDVDVRETTTEVDRQPIRVTERTPSTTSTTVNTPSTTKRVTTTTTTTTTTMKPTTEQTTTTQRIVETTPKRVPTTTKRQKVTSQRTPPRRPAPTPVKKSDKNSASGIRRRRPLSSYFQRRPDLNKIRQRPRPGARPASSLPEASTPTTTATTTTSTTERTEPTTTIITTTTEKSTTPKVRPTLPQRPNIFRPRPSVTSSSQPKPVSADRQELIDRLIQSELQSSRRRRPPPNRRRPGSTPGRRPVVTPGGRPSRPQRPSVFDRLAANRPTRRPSPLLPQRPEPEQPQVTQTERPIVKRPSRRPPVLPVRPSTEEPPQRPVPTLPERPVVEKPVRRPTLTLPRRPSLDETEAGEEAVQTTEVPRPSRRPPQFIRPSVDRLEAFSRPPVSRPGLFARPPETRPEPVIKPSVARPQESARPFMPVPPKNPTGTVNRPAPRPSPVSAPVAAPVPVKIKKPERLSIFALATQRPPVSSFGTRPVIVAQSLVAESPYRHTGGYSSIKMFGINAGKKHVGKPKKAVYKEKREPVTNVIGFSSVFTNAKKLPRAEVQVDQTVAPPTVQTSSQHVPEVEAEQIISTAAEDLEIAYEEQSEKAKDDNAAPQWQVPSTNTRPEMTVPQLEQTTEAFEMTTAESRWEETQPQQWVPDETTPTEQVVRNNIEAEQPVQELSWQDQEAATVTDRILSEIEDWTPIVPDHVVSKETSEHPEISRGRTDEQGDGLIQPVEDSEQYYAEPEQTIGAEVTEPEASTEASGYQQLEYYIGDPSDLQAEDSVWSPVVSGVVRVPVRPLANPPAGAEYQPVEAATEQATYEGEEPIQTQLEEEGYVDEKPVESYTWSKQETPINIEEYEDPQLEAEVDEPFLQVEEYVPTTQEADQMNNGDMTESKAVQNTDVPLSSRPFRPSQPQQFFEERPRPRPDGEVAPLPPRPRPSRPSGGWMSGLLSGLFGSRKSEPGSSGANGSSSSGGGGGGLLAGLFRRPTSSTPAPGRDELPPVQSDPILAAMFGAPGKQPGAGEGEAPAEEPAGRQEATASRPERVSPVS